MRYRLAISAQHQAQLVDHLFPGDGLEAAAIILCSRSSERRILVQKLVLVPHDKCKVRSRNRITWPGASIEEAIDMAEPENLSIILIHSHPGGMFDFSRFDDESDLRAIPSLFEGTSLPTILHGSAIMIPNGAIRARIYQKDLSFENVESVVCSSDDITIWRASKSGFLEKRPLPFSSAMTEDLKHLTACVVGVSGTGSIVAEQLARMGIGCLILIDFDKVELKNLNRIINSTLNDAREGHFKTAMFAARVASYRHDIDIHCMESSIGSREAIEAAGDADLLFCCVDSFEGRQVCDRIASVFLQPLFDVAVTIPTRKTMSNGIAIADVCGRLDYVFPGGSTLFDRGVYSPESLRSEYLRSVAPEEHDDQVAVGYLKGVVDEAPSVISLNMRAASSCVMEFIARCYPFRHEPNSQFSRTTFSLAVGEEEYVSEDEFACTKNPHLGQGTQEPLLGMPCFATREEKAA
jgi:hypothetical protein